MPGNPATNKRKPARPGDSDALRRIASIDHNHDGLDVGIQVGTRARAVGDAHGDEARNLRATGVVKSHSLADLAEILQPEQP